MKHRLWKTLFFFLQNVHDPNINAMFRSYVVGCRAGETGLQNIDTENVSRKKEIICFFVVANVLERKEKKSFSTPQKTEDAFVGVAVACETWTTSNKAGSPNGMAHFAKK